LWIEVASLTGHRLHTLSAEELYAAHLTPYLSHAAEELNTRIQKSQQENTVTFEKINTQRAEIERLLSGLELSIKDIEGAVNVMQNSRQTGFDELRGDVWQMEQEVSAKR
jgi:kinetochore protein NNF1